LSFSESSFRRDVTTQDFVATSRSVIARREIQKAVSDVEIIALMVLIYLWRNAKRNKRLRNEIENVLRRQPPPLPGKVIDPQSSPLLRVVLVHGTWGRGFFRKKPVAPWCHSDSIFVDRLLGEFEERMPTVWTSIIPMGWCGSNSIFRRAMAADKLKDQLETLAVDSPILIISHSHGGNVVLQATSKLRDVSNIYVCTLATPFFRLFESDRVLDGAKPLLQAFSIAACVLATFFLIEKPAVVDATSALNFIEKEVVRPMSSLIFLAAIIIGWIGGVLLYRLLINPIPKNTTPTQWQLRSRRLCEATAADARSLKDHLLVLRGVDDEAALTLAAGAVANRLFRLVYSFWLRLMLRLFPKVQVTFPSAAMRWLFMLSSAGMFLIPLYVVPLLIILGFSTFLFGPYITFVGAIVLFVAASLLLFLIPLTRIVFGRELAFGAMGCDAFFDSVPDSDFAKINTLGLVTNESHSHALYENPSAPTIIATWIAGHLPSARDEIFHAQRKNPPAAGTSSCAISD
jgi:hypothetical protein